MVAVLTLVASIASAQIVYGPGLLGPRTYYNRAVLGGNPIIFLGYGTPSVVSNGAIYPLAPYVPPYPFPPVWEGYAGTWFGNNDIPRTSDTIEATLERDNRVRIRWQGEPRAVARIRVALLDKDRKILRQEIITGPPAEVSLHRSKETAYYQVVVEYINGTTTTVLSSLPGGNQEATGEVSEAGSSRQSPERKESGGQTSR